MTGRERRLLRMLCMTASGGGGGDKPWEEMTWDDVIAATKNGKYKNFEIGAMKELDLGTEGIVHMQIVGIDADDLADGSGKAPLTFISKELLKTSHRMNPALSPSSAPYDEGTGAIGGWEKCEIRSYLKNTVKPLIPENVRNAIANVTKYSNIFNATENKVWNSVSVDDVWIPSLKEVNVSNSAFQPETDGPSYSIVFPTRIERIKNIVGSVDPQIWWLRTAVLNASGVYAVYTNGNQSSQRVDQNRYIALGFCL